MSRRESRDSMGKRPQPRRFEIEPSPKRSRRDGKPAPERSLYDNQNHVEDAERGQTHRRRLQDALPLEAAAEASDFKIQSGVSGKGPINNKPDETVDGFKHPSDPTEVPRSRSYFQHDERGSAGQGGRSFIRRPYERGRRTDLRERFSEKPREALASSDRKPRDDKAQERPSNNVWRHDGYYELEAEAPQPAVRKRPAFSEKKLLPVEDATSADVHANDYLNQPDQSRNSGARKSENRENQDLHGLEELNRQYSEPEGRNMRDERRGSFHFGGGTRGRDRYDRRYNRFDRNHDRTVGPRVEKWKHDLFDEANRSPPKNDEDQIAKIEALLAL
ncbi:hypothetical protein EJ110_NYTH14803 [Nymphaea thermarum]|nr:hypothetical protein EJ110_NYTH14803 [Nymphaea thermarum]